MIEASRSSKTSKWKPSCGQNYQSVDILLAIYEDEAKKMNCYMAGPIALHFIAASDAYLAPQQGRSTCMVEIDMCFDAKTGKKLMKAITKRVQTGNPGSDSTGDWISTLGSEGLVERYEETPQWLKVYFELNQSGIVNGPLNVKAGISTNVGLR
ncbi:hypothetical protein PSPO01_02625 [Paraphaeosphaeria sporulosa]